MRAVSLHLTPAPLTVRLFPGVFVPFIHMFGPVFNSIPIVQVSIDESLEPAKEWALGRALDALRADGVLVLAGGLPVHTFRDMTSFSESTARPIFKEWSEAILAAAELQEPAKRQEALFALTKHPGFRVANPREEHFVPLYVAAGAGQDGGSKVRCLAFVTDNMLTRGQILASLYGAPTIAFGLE